MNPVYTDDVKEEYSDNVSAECSDEEANIHKSDVYNPIYNEEYLYNDDIKIGNEDDPFGEYAERLN